MSGKSLRLLSLLVCAAVAAPIMGCAVAADLVNPAFLSAFGFDPEVILPSDGTIVVAFVNGSMNTTRFYAYSLSEPDLLSGARNIVVDVEPGDTRFMVLDCPVGAFSPGSVVEGTVQNLALLTLPVGTDSIQFEWQGDVLIGGADFRCGDVIEVASAAGDELVELGFIVTVVPGR
jgi:hypothetical protein